MNKKIIKNFLSVFLILIISFISYGCFEEKHRPAGKDITLNIYVVNDFHGALLETANDVGISKIGEYLLDRKISEPDNTLVISSGDMFQGTAVSSMSRGRAVVDAMNYIGFDAMTIGNHEFDWGIDTVLAYRDGKIENGELDCPFLAANIVDKKTGELASWAKPYTVVEKAGIKVGIIGVIGEGQESSILKTHVEEYQFTREIDAISKYAEILRKKENCDLVIVSAHNDTAKYNRNLAKLMGDNRVDIVLNGHTHYEYVQYVSYNRDGYAHLPVVQSGAYGSHIGHISITINSSSKKTSNCIAENIDCDIVCKKKNDFIESLLNDNYYDFIDKSKSVLGGNAITLYKDQGGVWASNVLKNATGSDIGVCNTGGIRSLGFPLYANSNITYGDIFEIMPFENVICTVYLKGSEVLRLLNYSVYISSNVNINNSTINGEAIDNNKLYKVATVDYIFVQDYYPFLNGENGMFTEILFRDALVQDVIENVKSNGKFYPEF